MQPGDKFKPLDQSLQTVMIVPHVHHINEFPQARPRMSFRGRGGYRPYRRQDQPERRHRTRKTTGTVLRLHADYCGQGPHKTREECKAIGQECSYCGRLGHFSKVCRQRLYHQQSDKTAVKHIDTEEQPPELLPE